MPREAIVFRNKSFCFTGKLSELKRSQAEREVRARDGLTSSAVNDRLDYLIVGSIPSPGWKFGDYGTKIAEARDLLRSSGKRPRLVSEGTFMDALALVSSTNSGAIDSKVVVINYKFLAESEDSYDADALEKFLDELRSAHACLVSVRGWYSAVHEDLFQEEGVAGGETSQGALIVECRVVRQMALNESAQELISVAQQGFEAIRGIDGELRPFERTEGSADYVRLLKGIPQKLRVAGL